MNKENSRPMSIEEALSINALDGVASRVYQVAAEHGFHEGETIGTVTSERLAMFIANLHGECSELWEAARRGKLLDDCDKAIGLSNAANEQVAVQRAEYEQARGLLSLDCSHA